MLRARLSLAGCPSVGMRSDRIGRWGERERDPSLCAEVCRTWQGCVWRSRQSSDRFENSMCGFDDAGKDLIQRTNSSGEIRSNDGVGICCWRRASSAGQKWAPRICPTPRVKGPRKTSRLGHGTWASPVQSWVTEKEYWVNHMTLVDNNVDTESILILCIVRIADATGWKLRLGAIQLRCGRVEWVLSSTL